MHNKIATIKVVSSVEPIEGADNIVKINVDGHDLVTQKTNGFTVGSHVVYFEVDAILPKESTFDWLAANLTKCKDGTEGYRITQMKRKGVVSDGLCLPLSYFEETGMGKILTVLNFYEQGYDHVLKFYDSGNQYPIQDGINLTDELKVKKYN